MKDPRWLDVFPSVRAAARHFRTAQIILLRDNFDDQDVDGYVNAMAFFHSMQSGHTAVEDALLEILHILDEEQPTGESWHADLISRCGSPTPARPAILSDRLASAAQQTRGFRHRATHATVRFEFVFSKERAELAASAGEIIAAELEPAIQAFADIVDPN